MTIVLSSSPRSANPAPMVNVASVHAYGAIPTVRKPALPIDESGVLDERAELR